MSTFIEVYQSVFLKINVQFKYMYTPQLKPSDHAHTPNNSLSIIMLKDCHTICFQTAPSCLSVKTFLNKTI